MTALPITSTSIWGELGAEVVTYRNDKITLDEIEELSPEGIVISPGPSTPLEAGISNDVIRRFGPRIPTLGVCLGHQCMGYVYGARVGRAKEIRHGKTSLVYHEGAGVLQGLPNPFEAIRYHSLVVYPETVPGDLEGNGLDVGRGDNGPAPQGAPGGRGAVPSRVDTYARRQATTG